MSDVVERSAAVVRRYGGTVEYNGDGVMALFGAPLALEDHAYRGCLAALAIQEEASRLAEEVRRLDNVELQVRVGLNSGRVIAGEIGSTSLGYRATGSAVVLAQRIESVAPPGGVLLSEATAQLVESRAVLAAPEWALVKGADEPVCVRRLLGTRPRAGVAGPAEANLVGRQPEMATLDALIQHAAGGHGAVVGLVGQAGIGKSRVAREVASLADHRGYDVVWAFCESHVADVSFHVVAQLLRSAFGVVGLDVGDARARVRTELPDADHEDLLLLNDLLGISDPDVVSPVIDPDARRRRITALMTTASLARDTPTVAIVEDVHWIDPVSESMLAGFLSVVASTPTTVLITARPEYEGTLLGLPTAQTVVLGPLDDSASAELAGELLGSDPSVARLSARIVERACGNAFFVEELVRELAQRGVLTGEPGRFVCRADAADVTVPATVEAAIESRIDQLSAAAKRTLNAAAVIGLRFPEELMTALGFTTEIDALIEANLLERVALTEASEYAFHHPLIQAVAYESQLKSDRAQWHRRVAAVLQERAPEEGDAALIADHLESAGLPHDAYQWHMRAAGWLTGRDITAARRSWARARHIANGLPDDDPAKSSLQIPALTMLAATDFHTRDIDETRGRFAELQKLSSEAGDKVSLAIGMSGLATELLYSARPAEAAGFASEQITLLESIGNPNLIVGLGFLAFNCWFSAGRFDHILQWSQTAIDLCDGDPTKGAEFGFGSPLAAALMARGVAGWWLGRPGWREDLHRAVATADSTDPTTRAYILAWTHAIEFAHGVLRSDDSSIALLEAAVKDAQQRSDDNAVMLAEYSLGSVLVFAETADGRKRAEELLTSTVAALRERSPSYVAFTETWLAAVVAEHDRDAALPLMRRGVDELLRTRNLGYSVFTTAALVRTLLDSGRDSDIREAEQWTQRLSDMYSEHDLAIVRITLLQLHALIARSHADHNAYADLAARYCAMAESLGFDGHLAWAQAMVEESQTVRGEVR